MFDTQQPQEPVECAKTLDEVLQKIAEHKGCNTHGGSGKASCGSSAGKNDLPPEIWEKVKNHPCYSEEAHHHFARMHAETGAHIYLVEFTEKRVVGCLEGEIHSV